LNSLGIGDPPRRHEGRLWLANWGTQESVAVDPDGVAEVIVRVPTTLPYCIDWLPDGRLLVVSGQERLLPRQEFGGELVPHADLNPLSDQRWNEIDVDGRGHAYVSGGGPAPSAGELLARAPSRFSPRPASFAGWPKGWRSPTAWRSRPTTGR
jgi:sugar lactone lactonase YvrE